MTDTGVEIATLWERTSSKGTRYFSGFLGNARVLLFRDDKAELRDGVVGVWKLTVEAKSEQAAARPQSSRPSRKADPYRVSRDTQRPRQTRTSDADLEDDISFLGEATP